VEWQRGLLLIPDEKPETNQGAGYPQKTAPQVRILSPHLGASWKEKIMKLKDLKSGDIFVIEETLSYPKLKIHGGYVDMRDDIVNISGNCDERKVRKVTVAEVARVFGESEEEIQKWLIEKRCQYL
jgi:hypothetical protein